VYLYGARLHRGAIFVEPSHHTVDERLPVGFNKVGCRRWQLGLGVVEVGYLQPFGMLEEGAGREGRRALRRVGLLLVSAEGRWSAARGNIPDMSRCSDRSRSRGCPQGRGRNPRLAPQTGSGPWWDSSLLPCQRGEQEAAAPRGACTCYAMLCKYPGCLRTTWGSTTRAAESAEQCEQWRQCEGRAQV